MIENYGGGLFRIWRVMIEFRAYEFSSFYIGLSINKYIPVTLRLGWFEVSFHEYDDLYDMCDDYDCDCDC